MSKGTLLLWMVLGLASCRHREGHRDKSPGDSVRGSQQAMAPMPVAAQEEKDGFVYRSGNGKISETRLPDGTQVRMHAGTVIRLDKDFAKGQREVWVAGDAIFDIKQREGPSGSEKPFVLHTTFLRMETITAKFRLDARSGEPGEEVDLIRGTLKVMKSYHSDTDNEPDELHTGDMVMINHDIDLMEKEKMDGSELKDW